LDIREIELEWNGNWIGNGRIGMDTKEIEFELEWNWIWIGNEQNGMEFQWDVHYYMENLIEVI